MCHPLSPKVFLTHSKLVRFSSSVSLLLRSTGLPRTSMPGPTGLALRVAGKTYESVVSEVQFRILVKCHMEGHPATSA